MISDHFSTRGKKTVRIKLRPVRQLHNHKLTFFSRNLKNLILPHDSYENFEVNQANFSFDEFLWFHHPSFQ